MGNAENEKPPIFNKYISITAPDDEEVENKNDEINKLEDFEQVNTLKEKIIALQQENEMIINENNEQKQTINTVNEKLKQENNEDWDRYDDLKLSDDEHDDKNEGA